MARGRYSVILDELAGSAGSVTFVNGRNGLVIRSRGKGANPQTAAQTKVRRNMAIAAGLYKNLSATVVAQWKAYAATQTRTDSVTGKTFTPTANNLFVALATKLLQYGATIPNPFTPPTSAFTGDAITLTVGVKVGFLSFTASGPNTTNVRTEILIESLASANRTPHVRAMRNAAFLNFVTGSLTQDIAVPPGYYASGYRFVNIATGQETQIVSLPVKTVTLAVETAPKQEKKAA